jgi:hypothetical protein
MRGNRVGGETCKQGANECGCHGLLYQKLAKHWQGRLMSTGACHATLKRKIASS